MRLMAGILYEVTDNFNTIPDGEGRPLRLPRQEISKLKTHTKALDKRTNTVVLEATKDALCIFNYMGFMARKASEALSDDGINNSVTEMLDTGYMPLVMLPSFMPSDMSKDLVTLATKAGLTVVRRKAKRLDGTNLDLGEDIWISKMEVHKLLGIHPLKATSTDVLLKLVSGR